MPRAVIFITLLIYYLFFIRCHFSLLIFFIITPLIRDFSFAMPLPRRHYYASFYAILLPDAIDISLRFIPLCHFHWYLLSVYYYERALYISWYWLFLLPFSFSFRCDAHDYYVFDCHAYAFYISFSLHDDCVMLPLLRIDFHDFATLLWAIMIEIIFITFKKIIYFH